MARGKIVCFYGGKGGVGKTTTLLSLAGTLSKLNKKVLIVDLDLDFVIMLKNFTKERKL